MIARKNGTNLVSISRAHSAMQEPARWEHLAGLQLLVVDEDHVVLERCVELAADLPMSRRAACIVRAVG